MFIVIFVILGIAGLIVNANALIVIPPIVIYICFGVAAVLLVIQLISMSIVASANKVIKNSFRR